MNKHNFFRNALGFGLITLLLLLVACDADGNLIIKPPVDAPDFQVSTTFSADEPKLIVKVDGLETSGLEKLEYKLERFSDQCKDSDKVYMGAVSNPAKSMSFDIATEAYGAYKLSVSATYGATFFQNTVKTILPAAPNLSDLPTGTDLSGLVFIHVLDDRSNVVQQIHLPDSDGFIDFAVFNFNVQLPLTFAEGIGNSGIHDVVSKISPIGNKDRKWCSTSGIDVVAQNEKILNSGEVEGLDFVSPNGRQQIFGQLSESDPAVLKLVIEPGTVNGNRAPFVFFNLVVNKVARDADGKILRDTDGNIILGDEIYNEDHVVQDCATRENPLSELTFDSGDGNSLCFENNDFPTS